MLAEFGGDTATGRRQYRRFVELGLGRKLDSPLSAAVHGLVLGSDRFVAHIREMLDRRPVNPEVPDLSRLQSRPTVGEVVAAVAAHFGTDPTHWSPGRRCDEISRAVAAYLARSTTGAPAHQIAGELGYRNISSVSRAYRRAEAALGEPRLAADVRSVLRRLSTNH